MHIFFGSRVIEMDPQSAQNDQFSSELEKHDTGGRVDGPKMNQATMTKY